MLRFVIHTTNKKTYYGLNDIPNDEKKFIYSIMDIHPSYLQSPLFENIKQCENLQIVSFDNFAYVDTKFTNEIAKFQKLSAIFLINHTDMTTSEISAGEYIYENKMLIINDNIKIIPPEIEYLNIISDKNMDYTNIPNTVKHLHLAIWNNVEQFNQTNLPIILETLNITMPDSYKQYKELIENKIKLPFNCKLEFEFV
jgi:hypothetical protein